MQPREGFSPRHHFRKIGIISVNTVEIDKGAAAFLDGINLAGVD
jgi:hypothetical protein